VSAPFPHYYALLARLHEHLRPRGYLEIGVADGHSLGLAGPGTVAVGVDPSPGPEVAERAPDRRVVAATSDDFFASTSAEEALDGQPLDLAFVDGLHLFEAALRDLANLERWAHPGTVVLVHDCHPTDERCASRDRTTVAWAGDVWKVVACLRADRPDLATATVDVDPTGLGVVTGFGGGGFGDLEATVGRWIDEPYTTLAADPDGVLGLVPPTWEAVAALLADIPTGSPAAPP
jgi:Methyltransferase domain